MGLPGADLAALKAAVRSGEWAASALSPVSAGGGGGASERGGKGRRIGAFRVRVHPLFLAAGVLSAFTGQLLLFVSAVLAALEHEFAHSLAARSEGYCLDRILLMPYGAVISGDLQGIPPRAEVKVLVAGPLINAATALLFAALWWLLPESYPYTEAAAEVSLSLFLVNLLPAYPLDGGRLLLLFLRPLGEARARLLSRLASFLTAAGIFALFLASLFSAPELSQANFSALAFSLLLFAGSFGGGRYRRIAFSRGRTFARGVEEKRIVLSSERTAGECVRYLREDRYLVLIVYEAGEYLGELTEGELFALLEAGEYGMTLKEALEAPPDVMPDAMPDAMPAADGEEGKKSFAKCPKVPVRGEKMPLSACKLQENVIK